MPSFTSRRYTPDRFRSLSKPEDDIMEDIGHATKPTLSSAGSLALVPSDGSLLDYFDLPSPPSTPHRPTHSLSYSSLNSFPSPATSPGLVARSPPSSSSSRSSLNSTPTSSPPTSTPRRWPSASERIHRLPTRPRSRSTSSVSSSGSSSTLGGGDIEMSGTGADTSMGGTGMPLPPPPMIRSARRTPYYPPNASRNADRARVYMNRGPHYVPNWTPLGSLPRHVQLKIEERMTRFTAL
ncbi:hypothetical protein C8A01DRAFT_48047 [Parachaetomium inaequale]|uniref:Uncharacterized protein n=1 Tax=Parachaetomium inaequale TaxID=2588326 RepID=A0AAN6PCI0_9PEZI|nr:hypothetical protein C8A01DRAFT_48047 [Parachaetomium inaequale]